MRTRAQTFRAFYRSVFCGNNDTVKTKNAETPAALQYKVVESSDVTAEAIEEILNDWTALGWTFNGMQFAMRESSKRPAMVFVLFTRP